MARGRIGAGVLRGLVGLLLGCLLVAGGWALRTPSASADPAVTVYLRDLTPPVVSVDKGGTVTFVNQIADKTVSVGVGPLAVKAVVHTDVTLNLPSGQHTVQPSQQPAPGQPEPQLKPEQKWTETFPQTCATCSITWTYRVEGAQLTQVLNLLPPLPATTPFVVNTLLPLPNLPGVNLPQLPRVNVPLPSQLPVPTLPTPTQQKTTTTTTTTTTTQSSAPVPRHIDGTPFTYDLSGVRMAPSGGDAVRAYDPSAIGGQGSTGQPQSAALGSPRLATDSASGPARSRQLPLAALIALASLALVGPWTVRTALARR